jgi:hypothetical protein
VPRQKAKLNQDLSVILIHSCINIHLDVILLLTFVKQLQAGSDGGL